METESSGSYDELNATNSPFACVLLFYERYRRNKLEATDLSKVHSLSPGICTAALVESSLDC